MNEPRIDRDTYSFILCDTSCLIHLEWIKLGTCGEQIGKLVEMGPERGP